MGSRSRCIYVFREWGAAACSPLRDTDQIDSKQWWHYSKPHLDQVFALCWKDGWMSCFTSLRVSNVTGSKVGLFTPTL